MEIIGEQRIWLTERQKRVCEVFSYESAKSQRQIEFGSSDTMPRTVAELARDNLIGKYAEVAFAFFLRKCFDISTNIDWGIYPRGVWDKADFLINGHSVDIKSTRSGGRWLLIELNKLEFRKNEGKLPDYFLFAVTGWDRDFDKPLGYVDLKGYASLQQICHPELIGTLSPKICENIPDTYFLPKYSHIPDTKTRLQADNCGRMVDYLDKDWNKLIGRIKGREITS